MPSMVSESCHITSACSGFPKLRQLTTAAGVAPTQARLATASARTSAVPRRGSSAQARGLESVVTATPPGESEQRRVGARPGHGVEEELVVVLAVDPARRAQQGEEVAGGVGGWRRRR